MITSELFLKMKSMDTAGSFSICWRGIHAPLCATDLARLRCAFVRCRMDLLRALEAAGGQHARETQETTAGPDGHRPRLELQAHLESEDRNPVARRRYAGVGRQGRTGRCGAGYLQQRRPEIRSHPKRQS